MRGVNKKQCILLVFSDSAVDSIAEVVERIAEDLRKRTTQDVKVLSLNALKRLLTSERSASEHSGRGGRGDVRGSVNEDAGETCDKGVDSCVNSDERAIVVPFMLNKREISELNSFIYSSRCVLASLPDANISKAILERVREVAREVAAAEPERVTWNRSPGIPDELFIRAKSGLTRREIRAIVVSKAEVSGNERVLDVGTGSGSVAIEFANLGCEVVAIEKDKQNLEIAKRNIARFGLGERVKLIHGRMEELNIEEIGGKFDVIFVGGTDNLEKFFFNLVRVLNRNGKLIVAAVRLETAGKALSLFKESGLHFELLNVWLSRGAKLGDGTLLSPSYPVFLFFGFQSSGFHRR